MASSVTKKTLTVTVNESISLGNDDYSSRTQFEIKNINEVSKRIFTVPTHQVDVMLLSSSAGAGTFASSSLKYARITNLDNSNFVRLTFMSSSGGSAKNQAEFKLEPLRTFVFTSDAYSGSDAGDTFSSFASFTNLKGKADTSSCDLEIYVATT